MAKYETIQQVMDSYRDRFIPEEAAGVEGIVQFNFSGDGGGKYFMVIKDQTVTIEKGEHEDPTLTVTTSAADWLRVNNGETNPMGLLMKGKLKIKGPLPMATKFQTMFARG